MNYEYRCLCCGQFDVTKPMALSAEEEVCPKCGAVAERLYSSLQLRVIRRERLQFGYGSLGRTLTKKETGGLDVFIPSMGAMEQEEVDYIAEGAIEKEKARVRNQKGPRSESQARIQAYTELALKTPKGKRARTLREAIVESGDSVRNNLGK